MPDEKKPADKPQGIDAPDLIPTPQVLSHNVDDAFDYEVAFNMAFVGVGQGGGRIADTFYKLGYRRAAVINGAVSDLTALKSDIPKLDLQTGGAGKDPQAGAEQIADKDEEIFELMTRSFGKNTDYILVCAGLGGGTGTGATPKVIKVAREYMKHHGGSPKRVGAILTLPHAEGPRPSRNAVNGFKKIHDMGVSPIFIIDNKRIEELFQPGILTHFKTANDQVAKLFHLFNQLAAPRSADDNSLISFDKADFATLLDSGIVAFGASPISKYASPADIGESVRKQLALTILAEVNFKKGRKAGCIFVGGQEILAKVPMEFFNGGFEMLGRLMAEDSMVHRGVYKGNSDDLRCYTMISELPPPTGRLKALANQSGVKPVGGMAKYLGVDDGEQ